MDKLFQDKTDNRTLKTGIIGLGYVGLPLAMTFVKNGFYTFGFDIDETKIAMLKNCKSYLKHIADSSVGTLSESALFEPTSDFDRLAEVDIIIICVPTPLTAHREPDLRFIRSTAEVIAPRLMKGQIVTLESTTYPGTSEAVKLTENIFRSVNIALVNELKMIYTKMGIDVWEVIDAAKTKPFGYMPFYPGPGLGGHCIPIDPFYLTWKAREYETPQKMSPRVARKYIRPENNLAFSGNNVPRGSHYQNVDLRGSLYLKH